MFPLYIDPGTGSMVIQFFIALIAGVALFYRRIVFYLLKTFFPRKFKKKMEGDNED
jgi:hypothetical protein